ncbi:hypothetical protein SERLA73DRAFT_150539 [Serpula lacrymans var. lacrymans S7.3]|uniref:Carbonic anhydrase n=1 Tax=Serpula lacrymans var. lacrymans (strain S7.3) TaxID=936435 RepID=F8PN09_SERL3|nr:hypothetical protein SERLA73DRAFT_150539 [Serpula lacrymans var. lacrymans S7.3]
MSSSQQHPVLSRLFSANDEWAKAVEDVEPSFFRTSAMGQAPKILWIGCSDSRVPESVITASKPGDIFVTRNIANQFHNDDDNALSVLYYAVKHVGVEHVVIVGHTQCGGAEACLSAAQNAMNSGATEAPPTLDALPPNAHINKWLAPVTALAMPIAPLKLERSAAMRMLVEENVKAQVARVCETDTIRDAWIQPPHGKPVYVHGWVHEIESGRLCDLSVSRGPLL